MKHKLNIPCAGLCILVVAGCRVNAGAPSIAQVAPAPQSWVITPVSQSPEAGSIQLTHASAREMSTAELAGRLLEPGMAAQITDHEVWDPIFQGGPLRGIEFFARPNPIGPDLCRRSRFYVDLEPIGGQTRDNLARDVPVIKESVSEGFQIALAPDCRLKPDGFFAHVKNAAFVEGAAALRRLAAIQQAAKSTRPLPLELRCTSELSENPCGKSSRAVLADLPLHQILIIQSLDRDGDDETKGWKFSVMPQGPGEKPFWNVTLQERPDGRPEIRMNWRIPAPF